MKIDTALVLCAGFGKRLLPLTKITPKPLLKIGKYTLLEKTIKLIEQLKIKKGEPQRPPHRRQQQDI